MFERDYRDLAHVPRWSIIPVIKRQSVAEHKYYVTLYCSHICHALDLGCSILIEAMRHGLEHDRSESYTSDIPGPVKRSVIDPEKEQWYELKEDLRRFTMQKYDTNKVVVAIRKLADLMDEYAYWFEEGVLGNQRSAQMMTVIRPALKEAADKVGDLTNNKPRVHKFVLEPFFAGMTNRKIVPADPREEKTNELANQSRAV